MPSIPTDRRKHGWPTSLDREKFDLRKSGSDAADEHAVRYFSGLMMEKMIRANGAGTVPWYVPNETDNNGTNEFILGLARKSLTEGDYVSAANYAMMLQVRRELNK